MIAGKLSKIITIEKLNIIKNNFGEVEAEEWIDKLPNIRSQVTYQNGNRVDENNELFFAYQITFTVRIYHDIEELDRVVYKNKKYRILSIEDNEELQLKNLRCELINE